MDLLDDWVGRFVLLVLVLMGAMFVVLCVGIYQTWSFNSTHECVETRRYWREGRMVGVVGKGGHWQAAGWAYRCAQFKPDDTPPRFYLR